MLGRGLAKSNPRVTLTTYNNERYDFVSPNFEARTLLVQQILANTGGTSVPTATSQTPTVTTKFNPFANCNLVTIKERALRRHEDLRKKYEQLVRGVGNNGTPILSEVDFWELPRNKQRLLEALATEISKGPPTEMETLQIQESAPNAQGKREVKILINDGIVERLFAKEPFLKEAYRAFVPKILSEDAFWQRTAIAKEEHKEQAHLFGMGKDQGMTQESLKKRALSIQIPNLSPEQFFEHYKKGTFDCLRVTTSQFGPHSIEPGTSFRKSKLPLAPGEESDLLATFEDSEAVLPPPDASSLSGYGSINSRLVYRPDDPTIVLHRDENGKVDTNSAGFNTVISKAKRTEREFAELASDRNEHGNEVMRQLQKKHKLTTTGQTASASHAGTPSAAPQSTIGASSVDDLPDLYKVEDNDREKYIPLPEIPRDFKRTFLDKVTLDDAAAASTLEGLPSTSLRDDFRPAGASEGAVFSEVHPIGHASTAAVADAGDFTLLTPSPTHPVTTPTQVDAFVSESAKPPAPLGSAQAASTVSREELYQRVAAESATLLQSAKFPDTMELFTKRARPYRDVCYTTLQQDSRDWHRNAATELGFSERIPKVWRNNIVDLFDSCNEICRHLWRNINNTSTRYIRASLAMKKPVAMIRLPPVPSDHRSALLRTLHEYYSRIEVLRVKLEVPGALASLQLPTNTADKSVQGSSSLATGGKSIADHAIDLTDPETSNEAYESAIRGLIIKLLLKLQNQLNVTIQAAQKSLQTEP